MHHQTGLFVDDHQIVVLIHNVDGNILRLNSHLFFGAVEHHLYHVARFHPIVALDRTVDPYALGFGSFLNAVARHTSHLIDQILVDAKERLSRVDFKAMMLVQSSSIGSQRSVIAGIAIGRGEVLEQLIVGIAIGQCQRFGL